MPCSTKNRPVLRLLLFLVCATAGQPQTALPAQEKLEYSVEWRLITAGKVQLGWSAKPQADKAGWQTKVHLESAGLVSKLFKVNDDYSSSMNENLCASSSLMKSEEGRRRRETRVTFDGVERKANYREKDLNTNQVVAAKDTDIPPCVHDVFGGLYLLRSMHLEPGQSAQVPISDGKKSVSAKVEAQARETVKTPSGTYRTIRYEAYLFHDVLYRRPAHLYVWLTDDARKLPVQIRVKMQFTIGTITLQLEKEQS
jgi:Protein of unknown function (DUF3108)